MWDRTVFETDLRYCPDSKSALFFAIKNMTSHHSLPIFTAGVKAQIESFCAVLKTLPHIQNLTICFGTFCDKKILQDDVWGAFLRMRNVDNVDVSVGGVIKEIVRVARVEGRIFSSLLG
ncbi:MAG: hypothetical protein Q9180_001862 [Flavoplaca navasiana]